MGKNRHSKDRMFITATEWKYEYGGKKTSARHGYQPLPFDHCALGLVAFQTPVCTAEGVIFDLENLVPYLVKYKKNPVTGDAMSSKDIIRLNMSKNNEGLWHCPVTFKVFNSNSHIVAIKSTGNVFSFDAVNELNIKAKNFTDLITGEAFKKTDIIHLQDPSNAELTALRDINNFKHLSEVREESATERSTESKVRHNPTTEGIMKEIENKKKADEAAGITKKSLSDLLRKVEEDISDIESLMAMKPLTEDVTPGAIMSEQRMGGSLTSTVESVCTRDEMRLARPQEVRDAWFRKMRQLGKKGYVQLQTTVGNINLELHCDIAPRTCWNFITLCHRGFYDGTVFHRLVKDFMVQGGDPTGTGSGGESAWGAGKPFKDEFDSRLKHDSRGVLSMANSGPNSNKSQFFITFRGARHLDLVHTIFGRVVGGMATLERMEAVGADKKDAPLAELRLLRTEVFVDVVAEAALVLEGDVRASMQRRAGNALSSAPLAATVAEYEAALAVTDGQMEGPLAGPSADPSTAAQVSSEGDSLPPRVPTTSRKAQVAEFLRSQIATDVGMDAGAGTGTAAAKKRKTSGYGDFSSW